jgi:hypothetical protein
VTPAALRWHRWMIGSPDERFSIEGDPEDARRGLLKVDSEELPPESERCSPCRGVGWPGAM